MLRTFFPQGNVVDNKLFQAIDGHFIYKSIVDVDNSTFKDKKIESTRSASLSTHHDDKVTFR